MRGKVNSVLVALKLKERFMGKEKHATRILFRVYFKSGIQKA